jgi:26S proteasome regulatory subunit N2
LVDKKNTDVEIDPRMESIVNQKFEQCFSEGNFKQVIGVAISCRRIDTVQQAIEISNNTDLLLGYTFTLATETIRNKEFRTNLLRMILLIY